MKSYLFPELDLTFESQYQFFALKLSLTSFFFFFLMHLEHQQKERNLYVVFFDYFDEL